MQIDPYSTIPLIYNLTDPSDSTLYYIRAVIKDSLTGVTLDTKNLASQGSGRYTSTVVAPQDSTGNGRHVDVTLTVYTDSGYSVLSDSYERRIDKYLVKKNLAFGAGSSGGSGSDVDYAKIKKILIEVVAEWAKGNKPKKVNLVPVYERLEAIQASIDEIEPAKEVNIKPTDLRPVVSAIESAKAVIIGALEKIEIPDQADMSPVIEELITLKDKVEEVGEMASKEKEEIAALIQKFGEGVKGINEEKGLKERLKTALELLNGEGELPVADKPVKKVSPELSKYFPQ